MNTIAVDPGVLMSGVAEFDEAAKLVRAAWWPSGQVAFNADALFIEVPRHYPGKHSKVDVNDLLYLSLVAGNIAGRHHRAKLRMFYPADWKRQVPKDVMVERIKAHLTPEEFKRVELPTAKSKAHNVWDAVGIGLFAVGRMKAGGAK